MSACQLSSPCSTSRSLTLRDLPPISLGKEQSASLMQILTVSHGIVTCRVVSLGSWHKSADRLFSLHDFDPTTSTVEVL